VVVLVAWGARHPDDDDEWMYVLDKKKNPVTEALELCAQRKYGDAIAQLDSLAEQTAAAPLVCRLRDRAEQAMLHGGSSAFATTVLPSVVP
jgi:hypothetical protein